jgi:hypothetical protein
VSQTYDGISNLFGRGAPGNMLTSHGPSFLRATEMKSAAYPQVPLGTRTPPRTYSFITDTQEHRHATRRQVEVHRQTEAQGAAHRGGL